MVFLDETPVVTGCVSTEEMDRGLKAYKADDGDVRLCRLWCKGRGVSE